MFTRLRRSAKAALAVLVLGLLVAACSSEGLPTSYSDQPVEVADGELVPLVELNWLEGCTVGFADSELADSANAVCACSFDRISADDSGVSIEEFIDLDDGLKGDPEAWTNRAQTPTEALLADMVKACICNPSPSVALDAACRDA